MTDNIIIVVVMGVMVRVIIDSILRSTKPNSLWVIHVAFCVIPHKPQSCATRCVCVSQSSRIGPKAWINWTLPIASTWLSLPWSSLLRLFLLQDEDVPCHLSCQGHYFPIVVVSISCPTISKTISITLLLLNESVTVCLVHMAFYTCLILV
jgi:hypothetical protein